MLLVVLGENASAILLQQLNEDEVQKVSREVAKLTSISAEQAEKVLEEFHHISTAGDYVARGGMDTARKLLMTAFEPDQAKRACWIVCKRRWAPTQRASTQFRKRTRSSLPSLFTTNIHRRSPWCSRTWTIRRRRRF